MSQVHQLMFGQLSAHETSARSFIFMLNTGAKLVYGVCVLSDALNNSLPSFVRPFHKVRARGIPPPLLFLHWDGEDECFALLTLAGV